MLGLGACLVLTLIAQATAGWVARAVCDPPLGNPYPDTTPDLEVWKLSTTLVQSTYSPRVTLRRDREVHGSDDEIVIWATVVVDGAQGKRSKATSLPTTAVPQWRAQPHCALQTSTPPLRHTCATTDHPCFRLWNSPRPAPGFEPWETATRFDTAPRSVTWTAHHLTCSVVDSTTHHDARRRFALYYAGTRTSKPRPHFERAARAHQPSTGSSTTPRRTPPAPHSLAPAPRPSPN